MATVTITVEVDSTEFTVEESCLVARMDDHGGNAALILIGRAARRALAALAGPDEYDYAATVVCEQINRRVTPAN